MATTTTTEDNGQQPTPNDKFFRYFQHEITDLQRQMSRIENTASSGGERADAVDHCLSAIARLSNEVQEASACLPAHDQRTYSEAIKALKSKLDQTRMIHAPKQKFSFKNKSLFNAEKNPSAISLTDAAEMAQQQRLYVPGVSESVSNNSSYVNTPASNLTPQREKEQEEALPTDSLSPNRPIRQPSFSQSQAVTISDHEATHIVLPTSARHATASGTVSNLSRCVLDMSSPTTHSGTPFATLTLKNIHSSLVICGHVSGAAHLTSISNSTILVACRQFRLHSSRNCHVYLLANSRPIIEDCEGIAFAPLPAAYMTEADQWVENSWGKVEDFKWLRSEPSPHWRLLGEEERVGEEVWRETVKGRLGVGVEEILRAVGVN